MNMQDGIETLQDLVALVQSRLDVVCALVTRVTDDRQFVLAHAGRPLADWDSGPSALDYSICRHCVAMDFPLIIDDTLSHPLMRGNLAVYELGVAAYIGAPVHVQRAKAIGAICAVEFRQRRWTQDNLRLMTESARIADRFVVNLT